MRSMVVYLTSHHLQAQSIMFIIANWPPDFSWLTVLIKKYVQIYQIGFSSFFFSTFNINNSETNRSLCWKERV